MLHLNAVITYLLCINAITFVLFGLDKLRAKRHQWRIRESMLLGCSLAGGSLGGLLAMRLFRHKTQHPRFRYGLPLILVAQALLVGYLVLGRR